jgi:hypothetical protein
MRIFKQYFLKFLFITVSMLVLSAPLVWLQIYYPHQVHSLNGFIAGHFWGFTLMRLLLISGFFMMWPDFIQRYSKSQGWEEAKTRFWLAQRFRITIWLIIFELLVCENFLSPLIFGMI